MRLRVFFFEEFLSKLALKFFYLLISAFEAVIDPSHTKI